MENVLITGSDGFIGSYLSKALSQSKKYKIKKINRSYGDITKNSTWKKFPSCKAVIHLAGKNFVPQSWNKTKDFFEVNVKGTIQALNYCKNKKARLIFISTYIYGNTKKIPISEKGKVIPTNPYNLSKKIAEDICKLYSILYGVKIIILRPFNVYGIGQNDKFLIPSIVKQINNNKIIKVKDLKPKRDFVYVKDLVNAIIKTLSLNKSYDVINIGSGISYSVLSVIQTIKKITNKKLQIKSYKKRRHDEVFDTRANINKAKNILKWKPRWSFEKGIIDSYGNKK
tara:strand:- start:2787 stop:3638 length:852 start_codon:yes stop_codon:yes gene_type:complete